MLDSTRTGTLLQVLGDDLDGRGAVVVAGASVALAASVLSFLFAPGLLVFPFAAFLLLSGVGWVTQQAATARLLTLVATVSTLITFGFITVFLFGNALPAILDHGLGLFLPNADGTFWNPSANVYSLVPMIWATVLVTVISGFIAGPLGVLGALFISEIAPGWAREIVKPGVEILAGIPSIVYGYIGFRALNGFVQETFLDDGASFLIAGIVVGVMALPTVVSVAEDALASVPDDMKDGSLAMGATRWQTMKSISLPASLSGLSAAVILGLGRAIGETMAVAAIMAAGVGLPKPLWDLFDSSATLTSLIATQYGTASESTVQVLFVAGILLFGIVAILSITSQIIERRMRRRLQGET
ncbi:MAG: phosphate ABC transporter permease subunit PstC [Haloarculaceae archaeon]